jgi:putative toxin-antitoxin system antitoxin component (TIGR02293 family)
MKEYREIENKPSQLREPMAIYHSYGSDIMTPFAIALKAVKGLSSQALSDLEYLSGLSKQAVARFLHVTSRSLNRYLEEDRVLDAAKSETLLKLIALYRKGTEVFGTKEAFNSWLGAPVMGIGNHIPFDLMETSSGIDLIDEELDRIAYGDVL